MPYAWQRNTASTPEQWDGNVRKGHTYENESEVYYNDPWCVTDTADEPETVAYVKRITDFYEHARRQVHA